jgi:hypothetical protein
MKMKAVNHEPVIRPEGTLAIQGGEEVSEKLINFKNLKGGE